MSNENLTIDPVQQAIDAMSYNGNGPECLPHLECGGCGCDGCMGGARRCAVCVHRVAVATVPDGDGGMMDVCGWCADEAEKAAERDAKFAELDRAWLAAGEEIRARRADEALAQAAELAEERGAA